MLKLITCAVLAIIVSHGVVCSSIQPIQHVASGSGSLQTDLNEFLNIIPVDDIRNLTKFFYANDAKMRDSYDYVRDKGFSRVVATLSQLSLVKKFSSFLNETGVNVAEMTKRLQKIVLTSEEAKSVAVNEDGDEDMGGIDAFFSEALSLIPQDQVLTMFFAKMEESNAFSSFLEKINASDYENLTESLKKSQGLQAIYFDFISHGIDLMEWAKSLRSFFGY